MAVGVHDSLRLAAWKDPRRTAVVSRDGVGISFGELLEQVRRVQQGLRRLGAKPGDRIASLVRDGTGTPALIFGVSAIAVYAPLNAAMPREELEGVLAALRPRWVLTANPLELAFPTITVDALMELADGKEFEPPREDRIAFLLHTSATTGSSKRVQGTLSMYAYGVEVIVRCFGLGEDDHHFTMVPLHHSLGMVSGVMSPLCTGGRVTICPAFDGETFAADWQAARPTWTSATPGVWRALAELAPQTSETLPAARFLRSAGAPLPESVTGVVEKFLGAPMLQTYGMTEAICATMETPAHRRVGSVGKLAAGELRIEDEEGNPVQPMERGLILLRGGNVTAGYDEEERNQEAFTDGWLITGDEGYVDADGYLFLTGRFQEFVNRGGQKVNPAEVDHVLQTHPGVARAAAFPVPDERLGEEIAAAVTTRDGVQLTEWELQEYVAERLSQYKVPRRIVIAREIPISAEGKYQRRRLAAHFAAELTRAEVTGGGADDVLTAEVLELFRSSIQDRRVGATERFFDYCDSLQAVHLLTGIEQRFGLSETPATVLWRAPNALEMAKYLRARGGRKRSLACVTEGGSLPSLVFIDPIAGYAPLWRELENATGVYGLPLPGALWQGQDASIERTAGWCLKEIRRSIPTKPYALAGWCLSGVVAFEVARQLYESDREARPVFIFDGHDILPVKGTGLARGLKLAWRHWDRIRFHARMAATGEVQDPVAYLHNRWAGIAQRLRRWNEERAGVTGSDADENAIRALHRYTAQSYAGSVHHILAEQRPRGYWRHPERVWGPVVQGKHGWSEVPGTHQTMFHAPHASAIARILTRELRAYEQEWLRARQAPTTGIAELP